MADLRGEWEEHGARKFAKSSDSFMSKWRNWESYRICNLKVEGSNSTLVVATYRDKQRIKNPFFLNFNR